MPVAVLAVTLLTTPAPAAPPNHHQTTAPAYPTTDQPATTRTPTTATQQHPTPPTATPKQHAVPASSHHNLTTDRTALKAIYDNTNGTNWPSYYNNGYSKWDFTKPVATKWYNVTVTGGRVTKLTLRNSKLIGQLPDEIGDLTALTELHINHNNNYAGTLPETISNLTNLTTLRIYNNPKLTGTIPTNIGNLTGLTKLYIYNNPKLSGVIPSSIGNLTGLTGNNAYQPSLRLEKNNLSGAIPATIGNLTGLKSLRLNENNLSGAIPATIGNLTNLELIYLHNNNLSGAIPASIGNLTNTILLDLNMNNITGIPRELSNLGKNKRQIHTGVGGQTINIRLHGNPNACIINSTPYPPVMYYATNSKSYYDYAFSISGNWDTKQSHWGTHGSAYYAVIPVCGGSGGGGSPGGAASGGVTAPGAPRLIVDDTSLLVFWDPGTAHLLATGYDIQYLKLGETSWTDHAHTTTDTAATITGLDSTATYIVRVRTKHGTNQTSPWSLPATTAMNTPTSPGPTTGPTLIPGNQNISALWGPPATGTPPTSYEIQHRKTTVNTWTDHPHTTTATTAVITGLTGTAQRQIRIRGVNDHGTGPWTTATTAPKTTTITAKPDPVNPLTLIAGHKRIIATWNPPHDNNSPITGYTIQHSPDNTNWTTHPHTGTGTHTTIENLTPDRTYHIRITATNQKGTSTPTTDTATPTQNTTIIKQCYSHTGHQIQCLNTTNGYT